MENINEQISDLLQEESELQFNRFNSDTALEIGMVLIRIAKKESKAITIDIWRNGHQLFHYACAGTSPDNDAWILCKRNTVARFGKSSLLIGLKLQAEGKTLQEKYGISPSEYSAHGGGFPIHLKNTGVIGCICVSGLSQLEDHNLITRVLKAYLKNESDKL